MFKLMKHVITPEKITGGVVFSGSYEKCVNMMNKIIETNNYRHIQHEESNNSISCRDINNTRIVFTVEEEE